MLKNILNIKSTQKIITLLVFSILIFMFITRGSDVISLVGPKGIKEVGEVLDKCVIHNLSHAYYYYWRQNIDRMYFNAYLNFILENKQNLKFTCVKYKPIGLEKISYNSPFNHN
jgi:hypothetical protein